MPSKKTSIAISALLATFKERSPMCPSKAGIITP